MMKLHVVGGHRGDALLLPPRRLLLLILVRSTAGAASGLISTEIKRTL
jgi:hypothetical protein